MKRRTDAPAAASLPDRPPFHPGDFVREGREGFNDWTAYVAARLYVLRHSLDGPPHEAAEAIARGYRAGGPR